MNTVSNVNGMDYLDNIECNSIDLILTDPPYITSRKTGMDEHAKMVSFRLSSSRINNNRPCCIYIYIIFFHLISVCNS